MIWRNLLHRKVRSILTMLGIAIGVAAVIALGAMAQGMAEGYAMIGRRSGADLLVTQQDSLDLSLSYVDEYVGARIAQLGDVQSVSGAIISLVSMEDIPYFVVGGYDPEGSAIKHFKVIDGKPLLHDKQLLLGKQAASNLKKSVGDTLRLYEATFKIVGIYETGQSFEEGGAVISLADAQVIFKMQRKVSFFQVQLRDPTRADEAITRIEQLIDDVSVSRASDLVDDQYMVQSMNAMAWGISLIAIVIGGLGMMNTMIMAVLEQTREIGVLRAVGWQRRRVLQMVLGQSLALSFVGGVVGIVIGSGLVWLMNRTPAISSFAPGVVRIDLIIKGIAVALVLGLVGGFQPAWYASNLSPIEALRYDGGSLKGSEPSWARMFGMTFRNLWRRRLRTMLTMGGIAIGVGLITSLGAITEGIIEDFTKLAEAGDAELTALQAEVADMGYSVIEERVGHAIEAMPEVKDVSGIVWGFSSGEGVPFIFVFGVEPGSRSIQHYRVIEGKPISGRGEMMLGKSAAEELKKGVGDVVRLPSGVFRVTGIFESGVAYEEAGGVVALPDAQAAFQKPRQVSMYHIKLEDPDTAEAVRAKIEERFGDDVEVSMSSSFLEDRQDIQVTRAMLGAISTLAIIVGGVVVTNTMVMTVMERTREIGTLRALGWRQSRVLWMVLSESLLLSLIAAGLGMLAALAFTAGLKAIPSYGTFITAVYNVKIIAQAVIISLFLGTIGGLYPAWHAGRLRPVEALRYE